MELSQSEVLFCDEPSLASLLFFMIGVPINNSIGVVRPCLCLQHFGKPLALSVSVVPEVKEEEEEDQTVEGDDVDEDRELIGAILDEEILGNVGGHHHELDLGWNKTEKKKVRHYRNWRHISQFQKMRHTSWMVVRYFFHHKYFW